MSAKNSIVVSGLLLAGCAVRAPEIPMRSFTAGDIGVAAAKARQEVDKGPPENLALMLNILAQCEQMLGDQDAAWRHFEVAGQIMGNWQTSGSETFNAVVGSESSKTYKGDPYEKAMNAFYAGVHYLWRGEPDNARACFKRGILADAELGEDKFRADFTLLYWLAGRASSLMGKQSEADDFYREAKEADEFARAHGSRGDGEQRILGDPGAGNLVLLVECGMGPVKYGDGGQEELARFRPGDTTVSRAQVTVGGRDVGSTVPLVDLYYQASTMGGTEMEGIRKGKAVLKSVTTVSGVVLLDMAAHDSGKGARDKAIAGGALLLLGLLTSTAADVRHWATLPDTVQVLTLDVPPGDHDLHLAFFDRNGAHLGALDQDWKVSVPEGSESFYLFRSLPGLDRIVPTASEPAAAPTEKKLP
ncbi:MAG: tetratricopeptide repeat protein [Planctomycetes bacterium]|nr:tetratricopeptide repeat protein [Planctomycetota bacterium]MCB9884704.1 tetratricopeptide repeat protein [Planctomycetota bacterium]